MHDEPVCHNFQEDFYRKHRCEEDVEVVQDLKINYQVVNRSFFLSKIHENSLLSLFKKVQL